MATIACVNFASDLHLYHAGFRDGAEALIETLEHDGHGQDLLVYPLVYCLRHAVELALKMVIRGARRFLDEAGDFPDSHHLNDLWNTARPLLEQIWSNDRGSYDRVARVIESLRQVDPEGEGFRYPLTTRKKLVAGRRNPTLDPTLRPRFASRWRSPARLRGCSTTASMARSGRYLSWRFNDLKEQRRLLFDFRPQSAVHASGTDPIRSGTDCWTT